MKFFKKLTGKKISFEKIIEKVEGQIRRDELLKLYHYARAVKAGCIVEIGSYRGKSTLALALGSKNGASVNVYSIDPHEEFIGVNGGVFGPFDLKIKYKNIAASGLGDIIFLISLKSHDAAKAWSNPIGLLWIDGDHSYEAVKNDFFDFKEFLLPDSFVIFHDTDMESIAKLIEEIETGNGLTFIEQTGSMKIFRYEG